MKRMLELGCGDNPRFQPEYDEYHALECSPAINIAKRRLEDAGYFVADYQHEKTPVGKKRAKLYTTKVGFTKFPYEEDYFDFILGDQFLEHLPRYAFFQDPWKNMVEINPVIWCMNECSRVAKPNAKLQFNVPKWNSKEMWQDPTHLNPVPPEFWVYFDELDPWKLKDSYGITASLRLDETIDAGWYHVFKLTAIK